MQVWDYNIPAEWQPTTDQEWEWFLVRKINYDNFKNLKKAEVQKYFERISHLLDPGKRAMLDNFFRNETH